MFAFTVSIFFGKLKVQLKLLNVIESNPKKIKICTSFTFSVFASKLNIC